MANELQVDPNGLLGAAESSDTVATSLVASETAAPPSTQPSGGGVAAVNAALAAVQNRQRIRITGQAHDLTVSSAKYERTDTEGSDAIAAVSV